MAAQKILVIHNIFKIAPVLEADLTLLTKISPFLEKIDRPGNPHPESGGSFIEISSVLETKEKISSRIFFFGGGQTSENVIATVLWRPAFFH